MGKILKSIYNLSEKTRRDFEVASYKKEFEDKLNIRFEKLKEDFWLRCQRKNFEDRRYY